MNNAGSIAYFSMEVGLDPDIPTYSGGLGILAGDTIKAAADLSLPFVAVTLVSRQGYFRQVLDAGGVQREEPSRWDPAAALALEAPRVTVAIEGRQVAVAAWRLDHKSGRGGTVPVYFLDTDLPENDPADRDITQRLYGGDDAYRLKGEIVLGIGGLRMLEALEIPVSVYHLNEGHAALLTLELLQRTRRQVENVWDERLVWDLQAVREKTVFTTHTPVAAGHDQFPWDLVLRILGEHIPLERFHELAGADRMNNTLLAMNLSGYINGVAKKHGEVSRSLFKGYNISSVTNGVHSLTWTHPRFRGLYDRYIPGWREEPTLLAWVDKIPSGALWEAHQMAKDQLFDHIRGATGVLLDARTFTIGFARRATGYKRMDLLLSDRDLLRRIGGGRLQLVFAGKSHPRDAEGKELIRLVHEHLAALAGGGIRAVYLPDYDMRLAQLLIPGVDLWLNTPLRPLEASGTSGMKAAHNGVPNFSVLDGWWIEGHIEGLTGWSIGQAPQEAAVTDRAAADAADAADLYRKLERDIMPLFYEDRAGWVRVMKGAIGKNAYYFNTHRMMRRYVTEAYLRSMG
jgi:starch phosphorylase